MDKEIPVFRYEQVIVEVEPLTQTARLIASIASEMGLTEWGRYGWALTSLTSFRDDAGRLRFYGTLVRGLAPLVPAEIDPPPARPHDKGRIKLGLVPRSQEESP